MSTHIDTERLAGDPHFIARKNAEGVETLEAYIREAGFAEHRHDTYAIGMTLSGVQKFRYRGQMRTCLPGQCHILHPDEKHDGSAGTDEGFRYRILYLDPALIQAALGGFALPFVANPVNALTPAGRPLLHRLLTSRAQLDELEVVDLAVDAARLLQSLAPPPPSSTDLSIPVAQLARVRELISAEPSRRHSLVELERVANLDRWTLARSFRATFGTSPTRFRTMRQLDLVRKSILNGSSLMHAAHFAGFSDQSHMTRKFKSAYGVSPARWVAAHRRKATDVRTETGNR